MAHYNTVFHTLAKILPRHEIDRLDRKYGQGDRRRKTSRYVQFIVMLKGCKLFCVNSQTSTQVCYKDTGLSAKELRHGRT